jgi:hypothetical protein
MNTTADFYKSFSGSDAICYLKFEDHKPFLYGKLTTISYSIRRKVLPVSVLGRTKVNGFAKAGRYVAGTMIATMINQHLVNELKEHMTYLKNYDNIKLDELPIFDIIIIAANEYGAISHMSIKHCTFADEGKVVSIQDLLTETQISYFGRDVKPFKSSTHYKAGSIEHDFYEPVVSSVTSFLKYDDSSNQFIFLTDYLDFHQIKWEWNPKTYEVIVHPRDGRILSWDPKYSDVPLNGVIFNKSMQRHVIIDEAALFKHLNNYSNQTGYLFLTNWLDMHGHNWEWNSKLKLAIFWLKDGRVFYSKGKEDIMPGTKYESKTQKHIVIDEAALYKFTNTPITSSNINFLTSWLERNGHSYKWDCSTGTATFILYPKSDLKDTIKLIWKIGEPVTFLDGVTLNQKYGKHVIENEELFLKHINRLLK